MLISCRKVTLNNKKLLHVKGTLLLASNHPNSFLDGVILDALFEQPLYSLARGDVFTKSLYKRLLRSIKILPVYRLSEGQENLATNYDTFEECREIFRQNGIVVIFSEGKCINEWHLRPLRKGTARLALASWDHDIPLKVLPVGINYSAFRRFGKNMFINFGSVISREDLDMNQPDGARHQQFNNILHEGLNKLVFEIENKDHQQQEKLLQLDTPTTKKILLFIPSILGYVLNLPLYLPLKRFALKRAGHNDHYDSVLMAMLIFIYPFYALALALIVFFITHSWYSFLLLIVLPLTAWSHVQLKKQIDK